MQEPFHGTPSPQLSEFSHNATTISISIIYIVYIEMIPLLTLPIVLLAKEEWKKYVPVVPSFYSPRFTGSNSRRDLYTSRKSAKLPKKNITD